MTSPATRETCPKCDLLLRCGVSPNDCPRCTLQERAREIAAGLDTHGQIATEEAARFGYADRHHCGPATSIALFVAGIIDANADVTDLGRAVAAVLAGGGK